MARAVKTKPVVPIQAPQFRKEDFDPANEFQFINQWATQITSAANLANGAVGPSVLPSGIDVAGGKLTGVGAPTDPSDAVSLGHAQGSYSPEVVSPKLDVGGDNALKGLTYLFLQKYVNRIIAGTNITISPVDGTGVVTINASGGGGGTITDVIAGVGLSGGGSSGAVTLSLSVPVSVLHGGTGTTSPSLVAGTDISVTGSWPDQIISFTGSTGSDEDYSQLFQLMGA